MPSKPSFKRSSKSSAQKSYVLRNDLQANLQSIHANTVILNFAVDHGLEDVTISDWKKMSKIVTCTRYYLMKSQKDIERAINSLVRDPQVVDEPRGSSTGS